MSAVAVPTERPVIAPARHGERLAALRERLAPGEALLVGPGAELRYLAGYDARALERLTLLVVPHDREPVLIVPRLEREPAASSPAANGGFVAVLSWDETQDPYRLVGAALDEPSRLFVGDRLWAMFALRIEQAFPRARLALASDVLRDLRMRKDADEIALLRAAAHAADRVVAAIAHGPLVGRTERDVAREVVERLIAEGHDQADHGQIVASGPDSASPHHSASGRVIQAGEPLVLDIGGSLGGYQSDITRTFWIAGPATRSPDPGFARIYDAVRGAHAAAVAVVRPDVACEAIDRAARDVIENAGYGPAFLHRTGHGIGLEVHEEPYVVGGDRQRLDPGMTFSIEPGIYLEGRYGARLEDIVACSSTGADLLNEAPRELEVVGG